MTQVIAALLVIVAALGAAAGPAQAQSGDGSSFLNPFPENDKYRIQVWGDSMAEGLLEGLGEVVASEARLQLDKKLRPLNGLMAGEFEQQLQSAEASLKAGAPHIAVVLLGAEDRGPGRRQSGRRGSVSGDEWKAEYARRLDVAMRALRKRGIGVFWVSLPVMRREDANADALMINELIRGRALANGVRFIDIFASFADGDKSYAAHGPDVAGKNRLLRDNDGVHFTSAGYQKLAYFVERELKRAAAQAWDERTIPLAGAEAEQARIRPVNNVRLAPLELSGAGGAGAASSPAAKPVVAAQPTEGGVQADNSRIVVKSLGAQGREESVTLEIVRPAIPAGVIALLTRRESEDKASQVGDPVMTEILGGMTVVSSVSSLAEAAAERRRGGTDASTAVFRVLQRGETLPPKPGRADEMPWPRPEPIVERQAVLTGASASVPARLTTQTIVRSGSTGGFPLPRRPSRWPRGMER